ncbi:MAG: hypothetical protein AABY22_30025 [Nanoarchaeota archaeon]
MIDQLKKISANMLKAAELLEKIPIADQNIQNIIKESAWEIKELEIYSSQLVENIELTAKLNKEQKTIKK